MDYALRKKLLSQSVEMSCYSHWS